MQEIARYGFAVTFVWLGFVAAISFMEAWVKFRAPSVTREVALDVGRVVFKALNAVEIALAVLVLVSTVFGPGPLRVDIAFTAVLLILAVQTIWLLPRLSRRAEAIAGGVEPPPARRSRLHTLYGLLEVAKAAGLIVLGWFQVAAVL